jgi:probable 2-oxoglutarate dehydrogenase E1 component DHKTD1
LESETFDLFMAKRFGQVKRYGLEGGEGMLAAMREMLLAHPSDTSVICMPHRGRLNLMTGLLGYPLEALFARLKGRRELPDNIPGSGDVLSHLWLDQKNGQHRHILLPNSSHLEAVNPVHMGVVRSLQSSGTPVLPIQIHGDAAFSGQGVIQETLQLSQLPGFTVSGTLHLIVNNQLGFTTPSHLGRSTQYASDPVKMISAPVFHVSGDDPVEIVKATRVALAYRERFGKDALVDIICYRRNGHNELDEPSFTQPVMYKAIRERPLPGTSFAQHIQMVP